ncbi:MAG: hypothetical protein IKK33_05140 [Lachnospiraceae bacterium]|nr:hypothetical protein [Lachnospiraceae bacterium]
MNSDYQPPYYGSDKESPFCSAALFMGILAILSAYTIVFPILFGCLGLLFAHLAKRRRRPLPGNASIGVTTAIIGICLSVVIFITTLVQLPANLKNPEFRQQFNATYKELSGQTFDELLEQNGIDLDALLEKY